MAAATTTTHTTPQALAMAASARLCMIRVEDSSDEDGDDNEDEEGDEFKGSAQTEVMTGQSLIAMLLPKRHARSQ